MPKIAFKATDGMKSYRERDREWTDGSIHEVTKPQADYLLKTHFRNFFTSDQFKQMAEKAQAAAAAKAEKDRTRFPSGDPRSEESQAGDTTGVPTDKLTEAELDKYNELAAKIDQGETLSDEEQTLFDRVETLIAGDTEKEI